MRTGRQQDELRHALRYVILGGEPSKVRLTLDRSAHRTLILSTATATGLLTYKDHGLLICDTEILLQKAGSFLKGADLRAFQEDIDDLINQKTVDRQLKIVGRMGWVHSKWMQ
jgi:nuclear-control-of-ATPase protein 2